MVRQLTLNTCTAALIAGALTVTACGSDEDATSTTDAPAAEATAAPTSTFAPNTTVAPATTESPVPPDEWAAEVIAVYDAYLATESQNVVDWIDDHLPFLDEDRGTEVDAYRNLTAATLENAATAVDRLPPPPADPSLAEPYTTLVEALEARAQGSAEINEAIETNLEAYKEEVRAQIDEAGQPFDVTVRLGFSQLSDTADAACFELQSALTAQELGLLTCIPMAE